MKYNGVEVELFVEVVYNTKNYEKVYVTGIFNKSFKDYSSIAKKLPVGHYAYVRVELANSNVKIPGFGTLGYAKVERTKDGFTTPKFLSPEY